MWSKAGDRHSSECLRSYILAIPVLCISSNAHVLFVNDCPEDRSLVSIVNPYSRNNEERSKYKRSVALGTWLCHMNVRMGITLEWSTNHTGKILGAPSPFKVYCDQTWCMTRCQSLVPHIAGFFGLLIEQYSSQEGFYYQSRMKVAQKYRNVWREPNKRWESLSLWPKK